MNLCTPSSLRPILTLTICATLAACASLLRPILQTELTEMQSGQYRLDPNHSTLLFKVDHMGFSKFVGRFNEFDASLDFDAASIADSRLEAVVTMASIDVNNREFEETLRSSSWLNTQVFPQAVFRTTGVRQLRGQSVDFDGEMTFLGVTHPVTIHIHFNGGATNLLTQKYTIGFAAHAQFRRSDFGLDKHIPLVGDTMELEIHAEFVKN